MTAPVVLAANLKWLFSEWPLAERFGIAAACGFRVVELSLPYELPVARLQALLEQHGQRFAYLLAAPGDWEAGERGLATVPGRQQEFRAGLHQAIAYARALGGPLIHAAAGNRPADADPLECDRVLQSNLRWACAEAAQHGLRLVLEPVCRHDYPRYALNTVALALDLIERVGAPNLGLLVDLHHAQWEEGMDAAQVRACLAAALPRLWHVQIALAPARQGPDDSDFDLHGTLASLQGLGYQGVCSCEYRPRDGTLASLAWARRYGIEAATGLSSRSVS